MLSATALQGDDHIKPQSYLVRRSSWFDHDPDARFVLAPTGEVLDSNFAASAMIQKGHLRIDRKSQIQLANRFAAGGSNLFATAGGRSPQRRLFHLQRNVWLAIAISRNPGIDDGSMFLIAREIVLGSAVELNEIADELGISDCERAVMEGIVQAICPKDISRLLGLSIHTIRAHIRSIYAKLGVKTAGEAQFKVLQVYLLTSNVR